MATSTPIHPDAATVLAAALVTASSAPVLLLDGAFVVVGASETFCRAFNVPLSETCGRSVFDIGAGEWNSPKLRSLLAATMSGSASIEAYEMDLDRVDHSRRRLVLNARVLVQAEPDKARLLLTVSDVTEARLSEKLKDDLLREKAILLQEVQHRVANSLQIIASVLLQSARQVQSEETRSHLHDAHHRVMSIASVQRQLATSRPGDVQLRPYFEQLCESLGASMIRDHRLQSLAVRADDSRVGADVSVSLGLIVTELVINALKHAFPAGRAGRVTVSYDTSGEDWTLVVADDGVGMPVNGQPPKPGLGTNIVEALARQLKGSVHVADAHPGTRVSISHAGAPPGVEEEPMAPAV